MAVARLEVDIRILGFSGRLRASIVARSPSLCHHKDRTRLLETDRLNNSSK